MSRSVPRFEICSAEDGISRCEISSYRSSDIKVFTFEELKRATKNFSRSMVVGEGMSGCVYKGTIKESADIDSKIKIAVKQARKREWRDQEEWVSEVNILGEIGHPNLVKLMGYCYGEDHAGGVRRLLAYEFMPQGSVQDHLSFRSRRKTLPWATRLRIADDVARGLAHLNEGMGFQVILGDLKSSNILLDARRNAKLSDFWLARLGPKPGDGLAHVMPDYAAPEYATSGISNSDTWSFGIFLYELITGRRPVDMDRPEGQRHLVNYIRPYLNDAEKLRLIMDPRLRCNAGTVMSARMLSAVADMCMGDDPMSRPKMSQVSKMLSLIVDCEEETRLRRKKSWFKTRNERLPRNC